MDSHEEQCLSILDFSHNKLVPGPKFNGASSDLRDNLMADMKEMYNLPYQIKIKNENHKASHGYMSMVVDDYRIHESLRIDNATELYACKDFSKLLWPQGNDPFCQTTHKYATALASFDSLWFSDHD
ncbi:unnamed protein product [Arabidopsis lyrata]|nr:unnamed protein product [Arabidopsis lyrata]